MTAPRPRTARPGSGLRLPRAAVFAAFCVVLAAAGHALASCATVPLWTLGAGFLGTLALVAPLTGQARSLPGTVALLAVLQTLLHTLFGLGQHGAAAMAAGSAMTGSGTSSASATAAGDAALVQRAAELVCGAGVGQISPAHAYKILTAAHLATSGSATGTSGSAMDMSGMASDAGSSAFMLPSVPMLLGHLLAAVVAGWLLRRGDLAVLRLVDLSAHGVAEGALVRSLRGALALACALCAGLVAVPEAPARGGRGAWDEPPAPHTVTLRHSLLRRGPPAAAALVLAA
ncbi:hypothetical protein [Streptomyces humi]|uniref:hypothetical protein n=1 Tax=Streptomyces humi TaxID=1428620 RepID=UPI0006286DCA|nr:hypothetical protein [Streptomyces humi]